MYDENMNVNENGQQEGDSDRTDVNFVMSDPQPQNSSERERADQQASENPAAGSQDYGYQAQNSQSWSRQNGGGQNWNYQNQDSQSYQNYQGQPSGSQNWSYQGGGSQNSYGGQSYQPIPPEPVKKEKKPSLLKKAAGIAAAALLFGVISGGTMVGINVVAESTKKTDQPVATQEEEKVTLSDEEFAELKKDLVVEASNAQNLDVSAIVESAMPSVVAINNTMLYQSRNPWFGSQTYEVPSSGSGIIVGKNDDELLVVSNNHVVENATELSIVFIDGTAVDGTVKGTDAETDLAVVAVPLSDIPSETMSKISIAELGDSDDMKVGQGVIAIGNALGYGQSVTVGYVSALNREVRTQDSTTRKLLQTDAAINPGNSGGALLNMKGQVIGINAAKYSDTDVEGMGYAIPISQAQDIINSLMVRRSGDKVEEGSEGYLGIQGVTVDDSMVQQLGIPEGVYVYKILDGGAASKTDLREKDVITKFDGQTIRSMASLQDLLKYYKVGETVEMVVQSLEDGQYVERTISITLAKQVSAN